MINNFISRNQLTTSNNDNSSFYKTQFPPDVFLSHKKFRDAYIEINLPLKIAHKESELYKSFKYSLGKRFLDVKPASLVLFENRLKKYFISTNFLDSFIGKKSINLDEKINMGSLDFYNLSNKQFKSDIMNAASREKILAISKNFSLRAGKDIVGQEFFRMKYQKKNAKRIAKILNNKNKNKANELHLDSDDFFENEKDSNENEIKTLQLDKQLFKKRKTSHDITNFHIETNNHLTFDKNLNINNMRKLIKHNSFSNKKKGNLINLQIYEYAAKNKAKNQNNNNYYLNTSNINKNREIKSKIFTPNKKKINLTEHWKTERKKLFKGRNHDINSLINKYYTNTEDAEEDDQKKEKNLFLLNFNKIKKLSKQYKISINNNVNELDDYTKRTKNKLLKLLYTNNIGKKIYIMKKQDKTELNELKDLLYGYEPKSNKDGKENNKNESEKKNLNQNQVQNKLFKTINVANLNKMMNINDGKINKKTINLEIKEIIDNCDENIRKRINIEKIRKNFKQNYKLIIKMRENLKYKRSRIYAKFKKFLKK